MKRFFLTSAITVCAVFALVAQNFYFEVGGGMGMASTEYTIGYQEGNTVIDWAYSQEETYSFKGIPLTKSGIGLDIGAKIGYGELFGLPLYLVGETSWTRGHTWKITEKNSFVEIEDDGSFFIGEEKTAAETKINHVFFGPGLVFYPSNNFQVAASIGIVRTGIELEISEKAKYIESGNSSEGYFYSMTRKGNGIGFGFNLSGAIDIGNSSGILLGGKFSFINNEVELKMMNLKTNIDVSATYVGLFLKYRLKS